MKIISDKFFGVMDAHRCYLNLSIHKSVLLCKLT